MFVRVRVVVRVWIMFVRVRMVVRVRVGWRCWRLSVRLRVGLLFLWKRRSRGLDLFVGLLVVVVCCW